jgi:oligoribonuclease NrnB/cAMP/cGMP phosphodiesterase (DHH superfamily)
MKELFNGEKFCVCTHSDGDGVGSYIVLKKVFGDQLNWLAMTGLGKISQNIQKLAFKNSNIFVTDISPEQEQIDEIDSIFNQKMIIDHHETSKELNIPFKKIVNIKACATFLVYNYCTKQFNYEFTPEMKKFVRLINDYDMWINNDPDSILLNNLYWDLGAYDFINRFKDGLINFRKGNPIYDKAVALQEKKKEEILAFPTWSIENQIRVVTAGTHISDIQFYYPEPYLFIIRPKDQVSLRSGDKPLTDFFKLVNSKGMKGGGHSNAGGIKADNGYTQMDLIELFYNFINK